MNTMTPDRPGERVIREHRFIPDDPSLIADLDAEARRERRSRNQTIQLLLEEALAARRQNRHES